MSGTGHRVAVITGASQGIGTGLQGMPQVVPQAWTLPAV
jgi:NADP-dependent 3-hydroxy acid dehydrogenase YdfG